jgi:hypothetical protein
MTTDFTQIIFDPASHSYTYHGQSLTSVSRIVSQLKPPFDREGIAAKTAAKRGVDMATILAEWDRARDVSMAKGTRVHEYIAQKLTDHLPAQADMFLALNEQLPEMDAFDKVWDHIGPVVDVKAIEAVVGDAELGIAGTVDALLFSNDTDLYHIWDWKTGGKFSIENRFQKLLPPFDDLDDCDLNYYSLQLSLYRMIVERNTDRNLGDCYVVHLQPDGYSHIHRALDLRERLLNYLQRS